MNRTNGRGHRPGEHLFRRSLWQKPPQERLEQSPEDETYRKNAEVEEGAARSGWHLAAPFHRVGDTAL